MVGESKEVAEQNMDYKSQRNRGSFCPTPSTWAAPRGTIRLRRSGRSVVRTTTNMIRALVPVKGGAELHCLFLESWRVLPTHRSRREKDVFIARPARKGSFGWKAPSVV